ncbi:serine/threonine-protein kinase [Agromyces aerolatus]|uniref:serine/threonine-protein kinase n=1 Tax=Agromyces sp. LY-1074 TaxID=3074080 RepID=UPI0028558091|nr:MULTISPECIES: protein kinase [unclassified Agromyces]MDR5699699.1 protein kinase [Agromyces sp. LY-1074]MDR5705995.1 protein kinase [Agromyces sp. LY-1358]
MSNIVTEGQQPEPPPYRSGTGPHHLGAGPRHSGPQHLAGEPLRASGDLRLPPGAVPASRISGMPTGGGSAPYATPLTGLPSTTPSFAGRYAVRELIGSGGMADVYLATDTQLGRDVAVKVFRAEQDTPADRLRREREIQLLGELNHLGLVGIYDAGFLPPEQASRRFIVMELVRGRAMSYRLASGAMPQRQVADIGAQVADALAYVHSRQVVHRDIKPENILISDDPVYGYSLTVKLADFGVAQFMDGTRLTGDGSIMGTAAYIAPEQARGAEAEPASDVYSLGLVLLEALRGEREYTGTPIEAALARLHREPTIPEDLSDEWRALLEAMTSDDPAVRPTAHDVAATLRDLTRDMIADRRAMRSRRETRAARRKAAGETSGRRGGSFWNLRGRRH